jgi:hypothetical protein
MLANIIDRRKHRYRFLKVNVVAEPTWHDNQVKDENSDYSDPDLGGPDYKQFEHVALNTAIVWAQEQPAPMTLYIYDEDGGIYVNEDSPLNRATRREVINQSISKCTVRQHI